MDMGKYFPCKWGKIDFFKRASRKNYQRSHRFYIWNRIVIVWRNFVQKKRKNRNTFSEIIMDMFLANREIIDFFKRSSKKSTRGHTDFIVGIELPTCVETLCKI
jgi:hypothetical protein